MPYPALQVFDTPAGDAPCTGRERSNSPLQALTTLNEPLFFDSAVHLAQDTLAHGGADDRERVAYAFRRCLTRAPAPEEVTTLVAFLHEQRARMETGSLEADALLATLDGGSSSELAAWALTARVLLNLDETIVRQ